MRSDDVEWAKTVVMLTTIEAYRILHGGCKKFTESGCDHTAKEETIEEFAAGLEDVF